MVGDEVYYCTQQNQLSSSKNNEEKCGEFKAICIGGWGVSEKTSWYLRGSVGKRIEANGSSCGSGGDGDGNGSGGSVVVESRKLASRR